MEVNEFKPGTYGCHEAMHMASVYMKLVDDLSEHPAIKESETFSYWTNRAWDALETLYQAIAKEHMEAACMEVACVSVREENKRIKQELNKLAAKMSEAFLPGSDL